MAPTAARNMVASHEITGDAVDRATRAIGTGYAEAEV
jgi:hypothetical protein